MTSDLGPFSREIPVTPFQTWAPGLPESGIATAIIGPISKAGEYWELSTIGVRSQFAASGYNITNINLRVGPTTGPGAVVQMPTLDPPIYVPVTGLGGEFLPIIGYTDPADTFDISLWPGALPYSDLWGEVTPAAPMILLEHDQISIILVVSFNNANTPPSPNLPGSVVASHAIRFQNMFLSVAGKCRRY